MGCNGIGAASLAATMNLSGLAETEGKSFRDVFAGDGLDAWSVADYDFVHPSFATDWRKVNVLTGADGLTMSVEAQLSGLNAYTGSAIRRAKRTGYGRYSVTLQPARGAGMVTGFFVYTGPYYGTQHNEVDIEFLGLDTTRVQVGRFVNGEQKAATIELGFDAADSPRQYGFDWTESHIAWWVDGCEIYRMPDEAAAIPTGDAFIFANLWAVSEKLAGWAGRPDDQTTATALIKSISYTPLP